MHSVYYSTQLASGYAPPAGLEPAIFGLEVRCLVHAARGAHCQMFQAGPNDFAFSPGSVYMPTSTQIYALLRLPLSACDDRPIAGSPPAAHRFWPRRATCRSRRRAPCEPFRQFPASGPVSCGSGRNVSNACPGGERQAGDERPRDRRRGAKKTRFFRLSCSLTYQNPL
jgi:hypothetical protein